MEKLRHEINEIRSENLEMKVQQDIQKRKYEDLNKELEASRFAVNKLEQTYNELVPDYSKTKSERNIMVINLIIQFFDFFIVCSL